MNMLERTAMKIAIGTIVVFMSIPVLYMIITFALTMLGYHVCPTSCWDLPEKFIAEDLPASECNKIINLDFFPGPTLADVRSTCVRMVTEAL